MNVKQILTRELRIHGLPVTAEAFIVVTPYFSYLVDSLGNENIGRKQPSILNSDPKVADLLIHIAELVIYPETGDKIVLNDLLSI